MSISDREPVVSVVMPTFNRLKYLPSAIESVFAQIFQDWELIIADDGSEAQTLAYLSKIEQEPRVKIIRLPHTGNPGAVRNAALHAARGEYIAFLDSDDLWLPSKLQAQVGALRADTRRQWNYTAFTCIDSTGRPLPNEADRRWVPQEGRIFELLLTWRLGVGVPTVMATRSVIERAGGFDEEQDMHEDYELWLRLSLLSEVSALAEKFSCIRVHDQSEDHFSSYGFRALRAKRRLLERMQTVVSSARYHALVRAQRARNAAALAAANAAAGNGVEVWRTLAGSRRYAWRYAAWWVGGAKAMLRLCIPERLAAMLR